MIADTAQKPQWAQQFNIDQATWQALCQQADRDKTTPLDIALDMGLLNENKLLQWDRESSKLPTLRTVFFNADPPFELWKEQNYQKCRAHACMPVGTWEGVTIWAKLSGQSSPLESENPTGVWVLAPWSGMKKWFKLWQESVAKEINNESKSEASWEAPAGLNLNLGDSPGTKPAPEKSSSKENATPDPFSMPAGLGAESKEISINFADIGLSHGEDSVVAEPTPAPKTEPQKPKMGQMGVDEDGAPVLELEFDTGSMAVSEMPKPAPAPAPSAKAIPSSTPIIPEAASPSKPTQSAYNLDLSAAELNLTPGPGVVPPIPTGVKVSAPPISTIPKPGPAAQGLVPPPPPPKDSRTSSGSFSVTSTSLPKMAAPPIPGVPGSAPQVAIPVPQRVAPTPPPLPSMSPITHTNPRLAPQAASALPVSVDVSTISIDQLEPRLKHAPNQDAVAQVLMGVWQNYFDKIMILLFQNDNLLIWWHNNRWRSSTVKGERIPVDTPSIFKIVVDTGHPYHGYVAPGEVNDLFFQKANSGEYPEHVTVVPVIAGSRVVAMLLGTCSKDTGKSLVLARLEENAHLFATALTRVMNPSKKAG